MTPAQAPRKRRWVLGLVVLVGIALLLSVVGILQNGPKPPPLGQGPETSTSPPAPRKPADCPDVQVIYVPGTYEITPAADPTVAVGLLKAVADRWPTGLGASPGA